MDKLVSVIVPCYNVEQYIDRCVESLVCQTIGLDKIMIILIDDCSLDSTWQHLIEIEKKYPDSVVIVHCDENGRQGKARNIGLQYVVTPYLSFVDGDDWVELDMYEKMFSKILMYDVDIVACDWWRDTGKRDQKLSSKKKNKEDRYVILNDIEKRRQFYVDCPMGFNVTNKLCKSNVFFENNIFFPENVAYEDHYVASLLYFYVDSVYIIEERMYHYYVNDKSTVMKEDAIHHFDILDVNVMLWNEFDDRDLFDKYREEIEYQFLCLCYLTSVKMTLLRMKKIPFDFFIQLKCEVKKRIPHYIDNKYVDTLVTDVYKIILELLDKDITEEELNVFFGTLYGLISTGKIKL